MGVFTSGDCAKSISEVQSSLWAGFGRGQLGSRLLGCSWHYPACSVTLDKFFCCLVPSVTAHFLILGNEEGCSLLVRVLEEGNTSQVSLGMGV